MKHNIKTYLLLLPLTVTLFVTSCSSTKPYSCTFQNPLDYAYESFKLKDTIQINSIRKYKQYIDSLIENDDNQKYIVRSIAEGMIEREIVKISKVGHNNKIDTTKEVMNGGFGKYTYYNPSSDSVFKILYHDNIDKNFYEIFYFKDNKLIYANIKYEEDSIGKTFYTRQEYYFDDKLLLVEESKNEIAEVYKKRVSFNLKLKGNNYLKECFDKKN